MHTKPDNYYAQGVPVPCLQLKCATLKADVQHCSSIHTASWTSFVANIFNKRLMVKSTQRKPVIESPRNLILLGLSWLIKNATFLEHTLFVNKMNHKNPSSIIFPTIVTMIKIFLNVIGSKTALLCTNYSAKL